MTGLDVLMIQSFTLTKKETLKMNDTNNPMIVFSRYLDGDVSLAVEIAEKQTDNEKVEWLCRELTKIGNGRRLIADGEIARAIGDDLQISGRLELAATEFAELLASERIEREQANGLKQCDSYCGHAARIVANAVRDNFS